ncbi:MAG: hypothetical protein KDA51_18125, partial [Planctomycetales bacterium]|nr:hypothetical protein [Planctomycetales bacterium]
MQGRSIPTSVLLTETLRLLPQSLLLVAVFALISMVAFSVTRSFAAVIATFSCLMFFSGPI